MTLNKRAIDAMILKQIDCKFLVITLSFMEHIPFYTLLVSSQEKQTFYQPDPVHSLFPSNSSTSTPSPPSPLGNFHHPCYKSINVAPKSYPLTMRLALLLLMQVILFLQEDNCSVTELRYLILVLFQLPTFLHLISPFL